MVKYSLSLHPGRLRIWGFCLIAGFHIAGCKHEAFTHSPHASHSSQSPQENMDHQASSQAGDSEGCWLEKPFIFLYKSAIADPQATADLTLDGLEADSFLSRDGHIIRGLVWRANPPKGYLLIALGTSMTAEEVYPAFADLRDLGLDIFIYNYRGFKESQGTTSLQGILMDIVTATHRLNANPQYQYRFLYGLSFGGIAFAAALKGQSLDYDGIILDSVPDVVPPLLFCPDHFDPRRNLPPDCSHWGAIAGPRDFVIGTKGLRLAEAIEHCGGMTLIDPEFGHIFMDGAPQTQQRLTWLKTYLRHVIEHKEKPTPPSSAK